MKSFRQYLMESKLQVVDTVTIGEHFLPALVNGDDSGLSDEDIELLDAWEKKLPKGYTLNVKDEESYIGKCEITKLKGAVVDVDILTR